MQPFARKPNRLEPTTLFNNCPDLLNKKSVADFWQWAFSDLLQNTTRGILAEYIVAVLLKSDATPRQPWDSYDLKLADGRTVEVKTMSYLQAWAQKELSDPRVVLTPKRYWSSETGKMEQSPTLNADLYVICFFTAKDHANADPLNAAQWEFFVLNRDLVAKIIQKQKSITLKTLSKFNIRKLEAQELSAFIHNDSEPLNLTSFSDN